MNPDKRIRHLQGLLYTSGVGTILFSLWSGIREIEVLYELLRQTTVEPESGISVTGMKVAVGIVILIVIIGTAFLYLYIGRGAMAVSLGQHRNNTYIILAAIIVIMSCMMYLDEFMDPQQAWMYEGKDIVLFVIDVTSNIILAEVVVYSILLKKLRN